MTPSFRFVSPSFLLIRVIIYGKGISRLETAKHTLIKSVQAVLGLDRIDEARQLIHSRMVRAGVALLGILLEHSLKHLIISNKVCDDRMREQLSRPLTMGRMLELLLRTQIITQDEASSLKSAVSLRNKAVHELSEPTIQEAEALLHTVENFVRKYIGNAEQVAQEGRGKKPPRPLA